MAALAVARPRDRAVGGDLRRIAPATLAWLLALALCAAAAGLSLGAIRIAAIDAGALRGPVGERARLHGFVSAVPRRVDGEVRIRLATADGRLLAVAHEPVPDLPVGREISARGVVRVPEDWEAPYLSRLGIARVLVARRLELTGRRRGGLAAIADRIRDRGEAALERGTPEAESALLRGFVLGEDDRIDPATVVDFQRSGLAHLLAVSGQNVLLLALLANPILALLGVPLRARLVCLLALIAVYVPVAGAGPSIQRAGVMGAAGVLAALAGRPGARWHALGLAAAVTLALDPRAVADVGWQLSFAAVIGIALWASPLREAPLIGSLHGRGGAAAAVADGAAVTIAATLATAPLMAHHFETFSIASLPANLLALPAVAPVMWLGMLAAALGQLPLLPVEPVTALAGLFAAYVAQIAHSLGAPGWAQAEVHLADPDALAATYALVAATLTAAIALGRRRRRLALGAGARRNPRLALLVAAVLAAALALAAGGTFPGGSAEPASAGGRFRIDVLDVGQGDAILLRPPKGSPILVDGGPHGDDLGTRLSELGVSRLAAAVLSHDESDHAGGLEEILGTLPVERFAYARAGRPLLQEARAARARPVRLAAGAGLRAGSLRIAVLWPPSALLDARVSEPNATSLVLLARWHRFRMLLTGDAEAESVPLDPGAVDVLKVAHHGSEDAELDRLLESTTPRLAVISVGEDNAYGHPSPATLTELAEHHVPVLRTDRDGSVAITVGRGGWTAD
jgi:competence protein ComEC